MDVHKAATHAAIMIWRDDQALLMTRRLLEAASVGMATLEQRLATTAWTDTILSADAHAIATVRPVIREHLRKALDIVFVAGARSLRLIDARLEALALVHAGMTERPSLPPDEPVEVSGWRSSFAMPPAVIDGVDAVAGALDARLPTALVSATRDWSNRISQQLGTASGSWEQMREAGRRELATTWIGPPASTRTTPFLTQMLDLIDKRATVAKEMIR